MATPREPRRVARQGWEVQTHLGELDSDVDELHALRERDKRENRENIERIESMIVELKKAAVTAAIAGFTAAVTLGANIFMKVVLE